jgi:hypothetical protein
LGRLKNLANRLLSDPIFWILAVLGVMVGFISFFERFTQVGLNSTYNLF